MIILSNLQVIPKDPRKVLLQDCCTPLSTCEGLKERMDSLPFGDTVADFLAFGWALVFSFLDFFGGDGSSSHSEINHKHIPTGLDKLNF